MLDRKNCEMIDIIGVLRSDENAYIYLFVEFHVGQMNVF